jgi:2-hydroxy-3-oxopropionate reductase
MADGSALPTIGFIGLGVMGRPMAGNLLKAGYTVVAHNRSRPAVDALVAEGAVAGDGPQDVASRSDVIITMLPDTPDVERVVVGDDGLLGALRPGSVLVDMSTIAPAAAMRLAERVRAQGAEMLDAPVSGGQIGAVAGTLSIMVGGDAATLERVRPMLERLGQKERIVHMGPAGAGQLTKVCNQIVLAATIGGVAEAFALARKGGVEPARVREALLGGFAQSRVLEVHGQRMIDANYVPGFRAALFAKDLRLAAAALTDHQVAAPVATAAAQIVTALMAAGDGQDDYSAMARVIFRLSGLS